ncbi:MAG TPA: exodeoxyribonuclease VII large subunit [Bryobacteraceae bacterium]|nr:exodeoxyribonuclease VII large subunit [Bryobacteraceae bacterium]
MEQIALNWGAEPNLYTVSDLTQAMREALNERFTDIWVSGEISGTRVPASGHYYFTLKDETAQLRCVCYRMTARLLKFKPQDGIAALVRGRIDFYEARGEVQMIVEVIEPQGHGALQLAFEQLKRKLAAEGLFEAARKRPIPAFPKRIGIVTSPSGAVIRDILQILERRFAGRHVRIFPAQVQGEGSIEQVTAGIDYFSRSGWAEVVIVARGGGSLEDLWTFNEETVARSIAASAVPVISAVGHETDFTIADFVADLRAPTPSAAAELVIGTRESIEERFDAAEIKLRQSIRLSLALLARRFHALAVDRTRLHRAIGKQMQRVDEMDYRLRDRWRGILDSRRRALDLVTSRLGMSDVRLKLAGGRRRLGTSEASIRQAMRFELSRAQGELARLEAHLRQLSPLNVLERGYAIVERDGVIVKSPEDAPVGSEITVRLAEGRIGARVTRATPAGNSELPW